MGLFDTAAVAWLVGLLVLLSSSFSPPSVLCQYSIPGCGASLFPSSAVVDFSPLYHVGDFYGEDALGNAYYFHACGDVETAGPCNDGVSSPSSLCSYPLPFGQVTDLGFWNPIAGYSTLSPVNGSYSNGAVITYTMGQPSPHCVGQQNTRNVYLLCGEAVENNVLAVGPVTDCTQDFYIWRQEVCLALPPAVPRQGPIAGCSAGPLDLSVLSLAADFALVPSSRYANSYYVRLCAGESSGLCSGNPDKGEPAICMAQGRWVGGTALAYWQGGKGWTWGPLNGQWNNGVTLTINNGDATPSCQQPVVSITIQCGNVYNFTALNATAADCVFPFAIVMPQACNMEQNAWAEGEPAVPPEHTGVGAVIAALRRRERLIVSEH